MNRQAAVFRTLILSGLVVVALVAWGNTAFIHAKASLARTLVAGAWEDRLAGNSDSLARSWPWADTWPVARLRYGDVDTYVLAGAHGSALAFGPGLVDGTFLPGQSGATDPGMGPGGYRRSPGYPLPVHGTCRRR